VGRQRTRQAPRWGEGVPRWPRRPVGSLFDVYYEIESAKHFRPSCRPRAARSSPLLNRGSGARRQSSQNPYRQGRKRRIALGDEHRKL
jgi:hypothetical protein